MAEVSTDEAMVLVNRLAPELGLIVTATAGFHKIVASTTRHYVYIQKSKRLGVINTSLPLPSGEPGTRPLQKDNGSVACHIEPELSHLERFLRMLNAAETPAFKKEKNRPFAATKAPEPRRPKPVVAPVPLSEIPAAAPGAFMPDPEDPRPPELQLRLARIAQQARKGRIDRWMQNGFEREMAERIADGQIDPDDARAHLRAKAAAEEGSDSAEGVAREAGIDLQFDPGDI